MGPSPPFSTHLKIPGREKNKWRKNGEEGAHFLFLPGNREEEIFIHHRNMQSRKRIRAFEISSSLFIRYRDRKMQAKLLEFCPEHVMGHFCQSGRTDGRSHLENEHAAAGNYTAVPPIEARTRLPACCGVLAI